MMCNDDVSMLCRYGILYLLFPSCAAAGNAQVYTDIFGLNDFISTF